MIAQNVTEIIGKTPILKLSRLSEKYGANIYGKCEFMNPSSSIKDRIAFYMIKEGLSNKTIREDTLVIEPTSGNTGIGLSSVCAALGLKLVIVMPSSMSVERRKLMLALGATLELTPPEKGMNGAIARAKELQEENPNSIILNQFENIANLKAHRETTAKEILESFKDIKIDIFVAGVGTGGSITGVGEILKESNKDIKIVAVEPDASNVLSGGNPGPHKIQGIGAGFIPGILNTSIYDEVIEVSAQKSYEFSRFAGKNEGILVGISSGANLYAASILAKKYPGRNILTMLNDTGERYLSTELFE